MIEKKFVQSQKILIERKVEELENEIKEARKYDDHGDSDEDKTQEFEELEGKSAVSKAAQEELKDLRYALKRIEEGKYGYCIQCNRPIEAGRLKGYLGAIYCSTHAR